MSNHWRMHIGERDIHIERSVRRCIALDELDCPFRRSLSGRLSGGGIAVGSGVCPGFDEPAESFHHLGGCGRVSPVREVGSDYGGEKRLATA
jgi:hypothetical protein